MSITIRQASVLRKPVITSQQIEVLVIKRETLASIKKKMDLLEASTKELESELLDLLEAGAINQSGFDLQVKSVARKYPHWKEHYGILAANIPGSLTTEQVLENTSPSVSKSIIVG